jgi:hypothetical protein
MGLSGMSKDYVPPADDGTVRHVPGSTDGYTPQFPRLLNPDSIKDTVACGVENGMLGYVAKKTDGGYAPFHWNSSLSPQDVEISDDVFLIQREIAEAYEAGKIATTQDDVVKPKITDSSGTTSSSAASDGKSPLPVSIPRLVWNGEVPHQKWMNFYTKVLAKFAAGGGLKITLCVEVAPVEDGWHYVSWG